MESMFHELQELLGAYMMPVLIAVPLAIIVLIAAFKRDDYRPPRDYTPPQRPPEGHRPRAAQARLQIRHHPVRRFHARRHQNGSSLPISRVPCPVGQGPRWACFAKGTLISLSNPQPSF